jgi:hypothetical protein
VRLLVHPGERSRMGECGRSIAERRHDASLSVERYVDLYRRLAAHSEGNGVRRFSHQFRPGPQGPLDTIEQPCESQA